MKHGTKRVKVTVSIDRALAAEISGECRSNGKSRSRVVEEALLLRRRRKLEEELKAGYVAMAAENRAVADAFLPLQLEVWR